MAITRNYSSAVLMTAGGIAIALGFIGKLAGLVNTIPTAVTGGLSIYLFGVIGKQGIALLQSEKVNLFDPKNLAIGATILVLGIAANLGWRMGYSVQSSRAVPRWHSRYRFRCHRRYLDQPDLHPAPTLPLRRQRTQ